MRLIHLQLASAALIVLLCWGATLLPRAGTSRLAAQCALIPAGDAVGRQVCDEMLK